MTVRVPNERDTASVSLGIQIPEALPDAMPGGVLGVWATRRTVSS